MWRKSDNSDDSSTIIVAFCDQPTIRSNLNSINASRRNVASGLQVTLEIWFPHMTRTSSSMQQSNSWLQWKNWRKKIHVDWSKHTRTFKLKLVDDSKRKTSRRHSKQALTTMKKVQILAFVKRFVRRPKRTGRTMLKHTSQQRFMSLEMRWADKEHMRHCQWHHSCW